MLLSNVTFTCLNFVTETQLSKNMDAPPDKSKETLTFGQQSSQPINVWRVGKPFLQPKRNER